MRSLPPIDLHTHIDVSIASDELEYLGAVLFCMTRSLSESVHISNRSDENAVWGVGCHPGVVSAQKDFDIRLFDHILQKATIVGEIGLDAKSRVSVSHQVKNLRLIFKTLQQNPRIVSVHSLGAEDMLLDILEEIPVKGVVLHWWLGTQEQTKRALDLGCYFSMNTSSVRNIEVLSEVPLNRVFTETDHPSGNKWAPVTRPGAVDDVEKALGRYYAKSPLAIRRQIWKNLGGLVQLVGCYRSMPRLVRIILAAL